MKHIMHTILAALLLFILLGSTARAAEWSMPEALTVIEEEAFAGIPDMGMVFLPDSVREIGPRVFAGSTLSLLEFPEGITRIDEDALRDAAIMQVTAPAGSYAWNWAAEHGWYIASPVSDFEWSVADEHVRIDKYIGSAEDVVVPAAINGLPVTQIGSSAFQRCGSVVTVVLPDGTEVPQINNSDTFAGKVI